MQNWRSSSIALVVLTFVWGGSVFAQTNDNRTAEDNSPTIGYSQCQPVIELTPQIPCTFWGIHVNKPADYPVQVPYGQWRAWDNGAEWSEIAPVQIQNYQLLDPNFKWATLDNALANVLNQAKVNNVLYTLSRTPPWAVTSTQRNDSRCNYYDQGPQDHGECYPPVDLNPNGTGTDAIWRTWVAAIAYHVNTNYPNAHIKYWEPWNEFHRSTIIENWSGSVSFQGTYDQLLRDRGCELHHYG
jgi:hypothetical protein